MPIPLGKISLFSELMYIRGAEVNCVMGRGKLRLDSGQKAEHGGCRLRGRPNFLPGSVKPVSYLRSSLKQTCFAEIFMLHY